MEQKLIGFFTNVFKGILYALMFGAIGAVASFILKWPLLKGVYLFILVPGVLSLVLSVIFFIGTPKDRYEFFSKLKFDEEIPIEVDEEKALGSDAWKPAIIGTVLIIIGFVVEALMH